MSDAKKPAGPDLTQGVPASSLADGKMLQGRVGEDDVLLVRSGADVFAVGAYCTHYHGPLADGLVVGDTVRCPWHHACFSLRTGAALRAPALDDIACWRVEQQGDTLFVREQQPAYEAPAVIGGNTPTSVGIIGGGAAGLAAADTLRREGFQGPITIMSADSAPPTDRPNLSKDYLAGQAQEDWIPLRAPEYYKEKRIELLLGTRVTSVEPLPRAVVFENGTRRQFASLLLATGADPIKLSIPGASGSNVHYLRSFADSRALVEKAATAKHVVIGGASFIGLEVAASLRSRGIAVDVVAPESVPLERVMGAEVGMFIQALHESKGVVFHLGQSVERIDGRAVELSGGDRLDADFIVLGVGVRPALGLAERAGIAVDRGVIVNEFLETSATGVFAAGDIVRWPDPHSGDRIRVEHWVVAERQGQVAARNLLGQRERYNAVPFFWSQHYDVTFNMVGHAERWDSARIDGSLEAHDCTITYSRNGKRLAVATIYRDRESLEAEAEMESKLPQPLG